MYFRAKSYKIPIYVIFVSLRTAAPSAAGVCTRKTIGDVITKSNSAKCPGYILQNRPEQQGEGFPSIDAVYGGSWSLAFPCAGVCAGELRFCGHTEPLRCRICSGSLSLTVYQISGDTNSFGDDPLTPSLP